MTKASSDGAVSKPVVTADMLGAFVPHAPLGDYGPGGAGPLAGMTLAVKDLFDVAGLTTGAGTPSWAEAALSAAADAYAVERLRAAGARVVGKTVTDELAWSLSGENTHYGTPLNPAAATRLPGGSSSGSAAAVAGGLARIALGTDTGGSVRLPASHCRLWGLRTTHGCIPLSGTVPLAPSYDTVGWFARDAATLARVGDVLLPKSSPAPPRRLLLAADLFAQAEDSVREALLRAAAEMSEKLDLVAMPVTLAPEGIAVWREAFRVCQAAEAWQMHGEWLQTTRPFLGPDIAARFELASRLDPAKIIEMRALRARIADRLHLLLADDALLLVPGAAAPPPLRDLSNPELEEWRVRSLNMLCPASHAGLPQLAFPALETRAGPLGLGLIAPAGADQLLLSLFDASAFKAAYP